MSIADERFCRDLLNRMLLLAEAKARATVAKYSRTLAKGMNLFILPGELPGGGAEGRLQVPHYWAVYVHDGRRGGFGPRRARFLVWFRDPKNDPRLRDGNTPVRARNLKRLTPDQFHFWLQQNQLARARGQDPPMIVTRAVRKGTPGRLFFANEAGGGMAGFGDEVSTTVADQAQRYLTRRCLGRNAFESDPATAVIR